MTPKEIRKFIFDRYKSQLSDHGYTDESIPIDFDLLLKGVIDSMGILELVSALEQSYGIELDMSALDAEKLTIIGPLSDFVASQVDRKTAK